MRRNAIANGTPSRLFSACNVIHITRLHLRTGILPPSSSTSTQPRVALITGAAQGIGRAIALKLADDGLDVAVNDIAPQLSKLNDVVEEIRAKGRNSVAVVADVSKEDEVKGMIEKTVEILGGVDCVRFLHFYSIFTLLSLLSS